MFAQTDRPMQLTTPLGDGKLLPVAFIGREALSDLFHFQVEAVWQDPSSPLAFDQLLGQKITLTVESAGGTRYFNGVVNRITQGLRDLDFTHYFLEVVPQLWLLTRKVQSRIFQHVTVQQILQKVLTGLDTDYQIQGDFEPREFCVQYRESDFAFASRLMEEEGIYYFFKHTSSSHTLVLANTPQSHPATPFTETMTYEEVVGGAPDLERIFAWQKAQEMRSGQYTLWDHNFQLPGKHLDANKAILETVQIGRTTHKLKVGGNDSMEVYDYPGDYARRFDGIDKGGADQPPNLQKIFQDNARTVGIRMQQEALPSLLLEGKSGNAGLSAGYTFHIQGHFSDDGEYVLTGVEHMIKQPVIAARNEKPFEYENQFQCIPSALPYRPERVTPIPSIRGLQTAVVVGTSGEEIFTDKYARIKVQFNWDREGTLDANSSCWVRVASFWAGKNWGAVHIPRIGQEVIVGFEEGNPDYPIVVGSVYNADMMPPYTLPDNKTQSGIKSRSSLGGGTDNFNEIRFEDKMGSEQLFIHAEKDMLTEVENDETRTVNHDRTTTITNNETKTVSEGNEVIEIKQGNQTITLDQGNQSTTLKAGNMSTDLKMGNMSTKMDLGKGETEAMQSIELKVGQSSIKLDQTGVTIQGMMIKIQGQVQVQIQGVITQVSGDAMTTIKGGIVMIN
ncbi:MAG TPA: type VI secretion system tip protein TssI/VgrG [Bryobacteraceae bacterium]|nr:type VI secretion system tip protein TssI/VgrG [Bryobacteraceae bacterium]